ncbi:MAG: Uma2 family endonuclease [Spirosomataceae bacterium]
MSNRLVAEILEEPDAFFLIEAAQMALEKEKANRLAFYNTITEQEKAEFINGEVVVHSPVMKRHNRASLLLARLMSIYSDIHQLGFVGIEKIMITLTRNDYEPDICFFKHEKALHFQPKQTLFPAPDWVIEILSEGTKERDRGLKFKDYQAHKIEEYWIIDPDNETIEQYHLVGDQYELILKSAEGTIKSFVMEGFQVLIRSVFDDALNLEMLQKLMQNS